MTRFRFDKDEVKYNDFLKSEKESAIREEILSSGIVDTIKSEPISTEFHTDTTSTKNLDNKILDSLTDSFLQNIEQDAARQTIKDYDLIHKVIKDDVGLTEYYNNYNNLKQNKELLDSQLKSFNYQHEDLWFYGFETNTATLDQLEDKKKELTKEASEIRAQAQRKFDYLMKTFTKEDSPVNARWFYKMYNNSGGVGFPNQNLYGKPEIHEKMMGNWDFAWYNPLTWDLWDPAKWDRDILGSMPGMPGMNMPGTPPVSNIMGPSMNSETGELQWKDTFLSAGQLPGSNQSKMTFALAYNGLDGVNKKVFDEFLMLHGDYENKTENFLHLNQLFGSPKWAGANDVMFDLTGGYGHFYQDFLSPEEMQLTLKIAPTQKALADKLKNDYKENHKKILRLKSDASTYINDALDVEIDKETLSLGLLYTFEELLDEMDKSYEKTKDYYVDEIGLDPKFVDLWYQNLKSGNFSDIKK